MAALSSARAAVRLRLNPRSFAATARGYGAPQLLLAGAILVGLAVRVWFALHDDGMYWPDEIHESLEPAHRLVFGFGFVAWEFAQGARGWFFPGVIAALLKVSSLLGAGAPDQYLVVVRLFFCLVGTLTIWATYRLARSAGASDITAAVGAALFALLAPAVYLAPRALGDTASVLPGVLGLALALPTGSSRRDRIMGVSLLGLASLIRFQMIPLGLLIVGLLALRRQFKAAVEAAVVYLVWLLILGGFDAVTWGGWFHSVVAYWQAVVGLDPSVFGTSPPTYYLQYLSTSIGWVTAVLVGGLAVLGAMKARALGLTALAILVAYSLLGHKELRFVFILIPMACALAAVGLTSLAGAGSRKRVAALSVGALAAGLLSLAQMPGLTFRDIGTYGYPIPNPDLSALDYAGPLNRLLLVASTENDLCGLKIESGSVIWSGGYSYLHRDVPFYSFNGPGRDSGFYNYVVGADGSAPDANIVARDNGLALIWLGPIVCRPNPTFSVQFAPP